MMNLVDLNFILIFLYGFLGLMHVIISLFLLGKGKKEVTKGHLHKLITSLSITIIIGYIFFIWAMLTKMGYFAVSNLTDILLTSLVAISFLMAMTYLAITTRDISRKFGFIKVGKRIAQKLNK